MFCVTDTKYPKVKYKKETFIVTLTCPLHSCVLLLSFSDNTENLACGTLILALERKDLQVLHIQTWVSCKKEVSSFDSSQVLLLNTSLIYFNFCSSDSETNIFQYTHLVKKTQSSQREIRIISCFNLVYSVRVQIFLMKTKVLISATTNAQHS